MLVWHALATVVIVILGVVALGRLRGSSMPGTPWQQLKARLSGKPQEQGS
jgi:hypothetical protein